jgi:hypothetical protein
MEKVSIDLEQSKTDVKNDVFNIDVFNMNLEDMEEMEPIESPAFIWGKWNFAGS